jgi:hypothetical protein
MATKAAKHRLTTYGNKAKSLKIPNTRITVIPLNNSLDIGIDILYVPNDDPNLAACWHKCLKGKVRRTSIAISKDGAKALIHTLHAYLKDSSCF